MRQINMKNENISVFRKNKCPKKKILFLGYNRDRTKIIDLLLSEGCEVHHSNNIVYKFKYDLIICFGYRQILKPSYLEKISCPIINLHTSYLPYNRGAHPNFWSFFDNTPKGVTIHLIDSNIDTGPILYQVPMHFNERELTFRDTYYKLIDEIEILFKKNIREILNGNWKERPQMGTGTFHSIRDLPKQFLGWEENIRTEISRLKKLAGNSNG